MNVERAINSVAAWALCPSCAQTMQLTRRRPRFGGLSDVFTFENRACGVTNTEECEPSKPVIARVR